MRPELTGLTGVGDRSAPIQARNTKGKTGNELAKLSQIDIAGDGTLQDRPHPRVATFRITGHPDQILFHIDFTCGAC